MPKSCLIFISVTSKAVHTPKELKEKVATIEQYFNDNQFPIEVEDYSVRFLPIDGYGLMTGAVGKTDALAFLAEATF